jgi:hypothetical protein
MEEWLIRIYDNGTKALILLFQQTKQVQNIPWKVDDFIAWELLPFLAILFALIGAIYTIVRRRRSAKGIANNSNTAIIVLTILNSATLIIVTALICWLLGIYIWGT